MIPLLVWPQEQHLGQMLTRVLAVLEEQDLYSLPGDVNIRRSDYLLDFDAAQDEDDDDDDDDDGYHDRSLSARHNCSGDTCRLTGFDNHVEAPQLYDNQHHQSRTIDENGDEVPIIVIRPVARRPRQQRRSCVVGTRRSRKLVDGKEGEFIKMGYRNLTQCSSQKTIPRDSRSRSRSPLSAGRRHHRHSNSVTDATLQTPNCQFPQINN